MLNGTWLAHIRDLKVKMTVTWLTYNKGVKFKMKIP